MLLFSLVFMVLGSLLAESQWLSDLTIFVYFNSFP